MNLRSVAPYHRQIQAGRANKPDEVHDPYGTTLICIILSVTTMITTCAKLEKKQALIHRNSSWKFRFNSAVSIYERKHREWEILETERKEQLSILCHKSRLEHLSLDTLARTKTLGEQVTHRLCLVYRMFID